MRDGSRELSGQPVRHHLPDAENKGSRLPNASGVGGQIGLAFSREEMAMAKITKLCVGELLVGEGNEVAHIDLIMGPRGSAAETAFANALTNNKDGFTSLLAVVAPNLLCKPATVHVQQGDDQGRQAGGADVRPGAARGRQGGGRQRRRRRDPGGRGRRPVHLRRRVHPLGSGRRQEDPGVQLQGRQGIDRARRRRRARRPAKSSPSATRSSTRSPLRTETAARRARLRQSSKVSFAGWPSGSVCHDRACPVPWNWDMLSFYAWRMSSANRYPLRRNMRCGS